eukprot:scpid84477/ scgid11424/ Leucine-rich repeat-containing protein 40
MGSYRGSFAPAGAAEPLLRGVPEGLPETERQESGSMCCPTPRSSNGRGSVFPSMSFWCWAGIIFLLASRVTESSGSCGNCSCTGNLTELRCPIGETRIFLARQGIIQVPNGAFGTARLLSLELPHNRLISRFIGDSVLDRSSRSLLLLNLSSNHLDSMPKAVSKLEVLQTLDLSHNKIINVAADSLQSLSQLRSLYLNDNLISTLPDYLLASTGHTLQHIDLGHNFFRGVWPTAALINCTVVQTLSMASAGLGTPPDDFFLQMGSTLKRLQLGGNYLRSWPATALQDLPALQILDVSHNLISSLPTNALASNIQLREIDLGGNQLTNLSGQDWRNLTQLQVLDVSGNSLPADGLDDVVLPSQLTLINYANSTVTTSHSTTPTTRLSFSTTTQPPPTPTPPRTTTWASTTPILTSTTRIPTPFTEVQTSANHLPNSTGQLPT